MLVNFAKQIINKCNGKKSNGKRNISVCTFKKEEERQNDNDRVESIAQNLNRSGNSTLLQTAIAIVSNLSNTKSGNSATFFDNGSSL